MNPSEHRQSLIRTFVRHRNAANLLMVLMLIFGAFGILKLNTQFFPTVASNIITVVVSWPGASAEDVETNLLAAIEPEVRFLDGVDEVISSAREGGADVSIEFVRGADMQKALSDVEAAVSALTTLPEEAETPSVSRRLSRERVARLSVAGPFSEAALREYAKELRDALLTAGVDAVTFEGLREQEIRVTIPEWQLRRFGLTVNDVSERVAAASRDIPSGTLDGAVDKQVRALAQDETEFGIRDIEILTLPSGERVRLRDIASVDVDHDRDGILSFIDRKPAIELTILRSVDSDMIETSEIVDRVLAQLTPTFPPTLEVKKYGVRADRVQARINLLLFNGLSGLVLVVTILFIFLNARIAFWVAAGIPVALMATLGIMWLSGQTLNMISLFALIMTLGIIVDDAIVVGEHTATRLAMGDSPAMAAENGAGRMIAPVVAASLTTMAAFMPILLVEGRIGDFMSALPLVVIAVLIASIIECFLILPGHLRHARDERLNIVILTALLSAGLAASLAVGHRLVEAGAFSAWLDYFTAAAAALPLWIWVGLAAAAILIGLMIRRGFRQSFDQAFEWFKMNPFNWFVSWAYDFRYLTVVVAFAVFALTLAFYMSGRVGFSFLPSPEPESIRASLVFASGTPRDAVVDAVEKVEDSLRGVETELGQGEPLIISSFSVVGKSGRGRGDNLASIDVELTASEERSVRTEPIIQAWRKAVPKLAGLERSAIFAIRGGGGRSGDTSLEIRLQGQRAANLKEAALELRNILAGIPGLSSFADDLPYGRPEWVMELTDRGRALGFTIDQVGRQVRDVFEGRIARRLSAGDEEIRVRVEREARERGSGALFNLELRSPTGVFVPLAEVVSFEEKRGFTSIQHYDGKTTVIVTADVDFDVVTEEVLAAQLAADVMPQLASKYGISYEFGGETEQREDALVDLRYGSIVALALMYIILAWVFASYWRPLAVMMIIPFGIVGAIWGHYLMDFKLSILSLFGLMGLAGILVNDSLILVSRLDERLGFGETLRAAAIGASRDRLRAVLLTSLTTMGGLTPLLFEKSLQAQFLLPMAITIVFGIGCATIFVLFLIPALVGIGGDISSGARWVIGSSRKASDLKPARSVEETTPAQ
ncbi:efflux RND transporter permease subunit [Coralliovum pocilloporae]|uniref:efflux RND transporter permease subunit n=1 Tax=Coralliovum pocilloporae TaxID=3066369 RepID=UPI003307BE3A